MPAVSMLMLGCLRYLTNTTPDIRNNSGINKISSCQVLLGPDDAVLSDELNHASIIDGIRLCRAKRLRYKHMDLSDLESKLKESQVSADKYKRKCNAPKKPFSGSINSGRKETFSFMLSCFSYCTLIQYWTFLQWGSIQVNFVLWIKWAFHKPLNKFNLNTLFSYGESFPSVPGVLFLKFGTDFLINLLIDKTPMPVLFYVIENNTM